MLASFLDAESGQARSVVLCCPLCKGPGEWYDRWRGVRSGPYLYDVFLCRDACSKHLEEVHGMRGRVWS